MKKSLIALVSICLSTVLTSCLKSTEPVIFNSYQVSPSTASGIGKIVASSNQSDGNITKAFQLRTEGSQTYLYVCDNPNRSEVRKIRAYVSAIPNQTGLYVLALEEGHFFYDNTQAYAGAHELFLLQPQENNMRVWVMDTSDGGSISSYFRNIASSSEYGGQVYTAAQIRGFLSNYADEYITEEAGFEYTYYNGTMTSCDWS